MGANQEDRDPPATKKAPWLNYAVPDPSPVVTGELAVLVALTAAPILLVFVCDMNRPSGQIALRVWLGCGVVLPWRYVLWGRHRVWAGVLLVICTLLAAGWAVGEVVSWWR